MSNHIWLNDEELTALDGLPPLHFKLYLAGLKRYMDSKSGLIGLKRGISWQSIVECLYIEPRSGVETTSPSKGQIRRAAATLETVGLITKIEAGKKLVFKCELATLDRSVQKQADIFPTYQADIPQAKIIPIKSEAYIEEKTQADIPKTAQADTPLNSRKKNNDNTNVLSCQVAEIFDHWREVMNHPRAKLDAKRKSCIQAQLKAGYTVDELKQAISGCAASPFYMGENDRGEVYDGLHLIFRSADHVDKFIANYISPPKTREVNYATHRQPSAAAIATENFWNYDWSQHSQEAVSNVVPLR